MTSLSPMSDSISPAVDFSVLTNPRASPLTTAPSTASGGLASTAKKTTKLRRRVNTAEKRSQHNAIERARRETLNSKFIVLARLLPSLASSRRPSKSAIVNGSITHLTYQRNQRLLASRLLRDVVRERDELLREVNDWRGMSGCAPKEGRGWSEEMEEVVGVEKEVFGTFASMDDGDHEHDQEEEEEMVASHSVITPQSSTDDNKLMMPGAGRGMWNPEFAYGILGGSFAAGGSSSSEHSPVGSLSHTTVLTPPMSATESQAQVYNQTPSPTLSHGLFDIKDAMQSGAGAATTHGQADAQAQQAQAEAAHRALRMSWHQHMYAPAIPRSQSFPEHSQSQSAAPASLAASQAPQARFDPMAGNTFNAMFQPLPPIQAGGNATAAQPDGHAGMDGAFNQHMMSLFPKYGAQPTLSDLQKAVQAGMGLGLGMMGAQWGENAVEGF